MCGLDPQEWRGFSDADPKPDDDHTSRRVLRAVSQDPIWRQDLARQELHGGLAWQAHRSVEHIVGAAVHSDYDNQ